MGAAGQPAAFAAAGEDVSPAAPECPTHLCKCEAKEKIMPDVRTPTPMNSAASQDAPVALETPAAELQPEPEMARAYAMIEARVLVDHQDFRANTLALLTEAEAASCAGWADTDPDAVAYVKSLTE
jgi:hypothetical protein